MQCSQSVFKVYSMAGGGQEEARSGPRGHQQEAKRRRPGGGGSVRWSVRGRSGVGPVELSSLGRLPLARAWWSRRPSSSAHGRLAKTRASPPCAVAGSARISAARAREALPISRMAAMVDGSSESESHESSTSGGGPSESEEGSESSVPYPRPRPAGAMSCDRVPVWPPQLASGRGRPAG